MTNGYLINMVNANEKKQPLEYYFCSVNICTLIFKNFRERLRAVKLGMAKRLAGGGHSHVPTETFQLLNRKEPLFTKHSLSFINN